MLQNNIGPSYVNWVELTKVLSTCSEITTPAIWKIQNTGYCIVYGHSGLFKVTLEFSFSFPVFSFSGLDLVFKSGCQTWYSLHISIPVLTYFYKTQQSKPGFEFFSQLITYCFLLSSSADLKLSFSKPGSDLELSFSNPGVFEFQVWNKPGIEKLNSRSTLISPLPYDFC